MHKAQYAKASILNYDARPKVRKRTTAALRDLGFRRIANVDKPNDLCNLVKSQKFELVIFAADTDGSPAARLVKQARRYESASDPYTPIILVSWNSASEVIRRALNTGTDQLLMWPFTTEQLGERVDALISSRKEFVETESYLGPDRRDAKVRSGSDGSVQVPNALRAKVLDRPELGPSRDAIEVARVSLARIKITNVCRRICVIAKVLRQHHGDEKFMRVRGPRELGAIEKSLSVIRKTLKVTELGHMHSFCDSVEQVTTQLLEDAPDLDKKGLSLLEQTTLALRVAMDVDEDTANAAFRLSDEVAKAV
ncbi:MAG: response regulator [Rhodospirillaceae bacterium]|jgi:DNA-binding response OmpR family regulator|nr:response regulator [Rhodospirillaceae bacterium]MBT4487360.1 response regulator [Rhodospirillaceae bacterium]MBT4687654.1 response regulator [Rhodospirillaceae bacterium]MBT5193890.1 response regulator [Rhodospirillaceae bacterium]MBT5898991.1 response regulator [Rhodospirillaceae bacterium]